MQIIFSAVTMSTLVTMLMMSFGKQVDAPLKNCRTAHCLYQAIVKSRSTKYTFDSCKAFDGKLSRRPDRDDMGKLCRLYVARKLAATRKLNKCRNVNPLKPDYDDTVAEHGMWVYSNEIFKSVPLETRMVDSLASNDFNNKAMNYTFVLSRFNQFNEKYKVKKLIKRKGRKTRVRYVKKTNTRKMAFDVYYCVAGKKNPRYIPYFYTVRMTPSVIGENNTEKKMSAKERYSLQYVKQQYLKVPPLQDAKVIGQLGTAKLKGRYMSYELVDFNGDGHKDIVFLDDVFKKYRPGVCLYQQGKSACKVIVPKGYSQSGILFREPHLTARPKKGIEITIVDKQYKGNKESFKYVYKKESLKLTR